MKQCRRCNHQIAPSPLILLSSLIFFISHINNAAHAVVEIEGAYLFTQHGRVRKVKYDSRPADFGYRFLKYFPHPTNIMLPPTFYEDPYFCSFPPLETTGENEDDYGGDGNPGFSRRRSLFPTTPKNGTSDKVQPFESEIPKLIGIANSIPGGEFLPLRQPNSGGDDLYSSSTTTTVVRDETATLTKNKMKPFDAMERELATDCEGTNCDIHRRIALVVKRGKCSFVTKAKNVMALHKYLQHISSSPGYESMRIPDIRYVIVYNNQTENNDSLFRMSMNGTRQEKRAIKVGMLLIKKNDGMDLIRRIRNQASLENLDPRVPLFDLSVDPAGSNEKFAGGWYFGASLDSSRLDQNYLGNGDYNDNRSKRFSNDRDDNNIDNSNIDPSDTSDPETETQQREPPRSGVWQHGDGHGSGWNGGLTSWIPTVSKVFFSLLLAMPLVGGVMNWYRFGGRVRFVRSEATGRITGIRFIHPHQPFRGILGRVNRTRYPNGGKLTRDQVMALPEVEFDASIFGQMDDPSAEQGRAGTDTTPISPATSNPIAPMGTCCSICIDDFDDGEKVRMLPCSHLYHLDCIMPWLTERQGVCPLCKQHVLYHNTDTSSQSATETPDQIEESPAIEVTQSDGVLIDVEGDRSREIREEDRDLELGNVNVNINEEMDNEEQSSQFGNINEVEISEQEDSIHHGPDENENTEGQITIPRNITEQENSQFQDFSLDNGNISGNGRNCVENTEMQNSVHAVDDGKENMGGLQCQLGNTSEGEIGEIQDPLHIATDKEFNPGEEQDSTSTGEHSELSNANEGVSAMMQDPFHRIADNNLNHARQQNNHRDDEFENGIDRDEDSELGHVVQPNTGEVESSQINDASEENEDTYHDTTEEDEQQLFE